MFLGSVDLFKKYMLTLAWPSVIILYIIIIPPIVLYNFISIKNVIIIIPE